MNTIKGKVIVKNETIKVTEKFSKRTFVVEVVGKYTDEILIELQQDNCDLIDKIQLGSEVEVSVNLRGRKWVNPKGESQWFNTVVGWKIDILSGTALQSTSEKLSDVVNRATIADEFGDDLPF